MTRYVLKLARANAAPVFRGLGTSLLLPAIAGIGLLSVLPAASGASSGPDARLSGSQIADTPQSAGPRTYRLGNTSQNVIDRCMSESDKQMLTQVNTARSRPRNCGGKRYPATAALSWHCTLEDVAFAHSRYMGDNGFLGHTGADGLTAGDRVRHAGYNWSSVGENIAAGQLSIDSVLAAWLGSPGHCANIMNPVYTEIGAASYHVDGTDYPIYWTQVFAMP